MSMFRTECCPDRGLLQTPMRKMGAPLTGETNYLLSCHDASCRKSGFILLCNGATTRALFEDCSAWEFNNPISRRASAMKESPINLDQP